MTPDQLAKSGTEHAHQRALFAYCAVAQRRGFAVADMWAETGKLPQYVALRTNALPQLAWIHAVHNQGHGDAIRGARAKAEGVRKGVADIFLPYPIQQPDTFYYSGLYIEMKKPAAKPKSNAAKGPVSTEQIEFRDYCREVGYAWEVCYSWDEAAKVIQCYLEG